MNQAIGAAIALAVIFAAPGVGAEPHKSGFISPAADPGLCGEDGKMCYDSGWVKVNNASSHVESFAHKLASTPRFVSIVFSPTADDNEVFPLNWSWEPGLSGNPATIQITNHDVQLHIYHDRYVHGVWNPQTGWRKYSEGYFRVFARQ